MDPKRIDELAGWFDTHELTDEDFDRMELAQPVPTDQVMITTSLRLPKSIMDEVRARAEQRGVKPTALMREWIEAALADQTVDVPLSVIAAAVAEYQHRRVA
jgi:hypothetical protein